MRRRTHSELIAATLVFAAGCGAAARAPAVGSVRGPLSVVVEGPCPKLAVRAIGTHRFLIYGDDGYELESWLPGERLAASESIAELEPRGAFRRRSLLEGLPSDSRGYVPFDLEMGGLSTERAWLLVLTTRYRPHGQGALFERTGEGFTFASDHWIRSDEESPVDLPLEAKHLPPIPVSTACAKLDLPSDTQTVFVPLASARTPRGGLFIAGRCSDLGITNLRNTTIVVLHGAPNQSTWEVAKTPGTEPLDGIVNVAIDATSDEDASLVAYEPFKEPKERRPYLSHYDGRGWREVATGIDDGLMDVARAADGSLYLAAGRALYRLRTSGQSERMTLPSLRFVGAPPPVEASPTRPNEKRATEPLHVRTVAILGANELWVGASYRVEVPGSDDKPRSMRASALLSTSTFPRPLYCDAREPAEAALTEIEGSP